jgi:hypothetical protein
LAGYSSCLQALNLCIDIVIATNIVVFKNLKVLRILRQLSVLPSWASC